MEPIAGCFWIRGGGSYKLMVMNLISSSHCHAHFGWLISSCFVQILLHVSINLVGSCVFLLSLLKACSDSGERSHELESLRHNFDIAKIEHEKLHTPSASSALVIGGILGLIQAIFLIFGAKPLLNFMGVGSDSLMLKPAQQYLTLRSLGAPAVLLSLAMQGVFRGFKDTKTPLYATVAGDVANIILDPKFIFVFRLGVRLSAVQPLPMLYLST